MGAKKREPRRGRGDGKTGRPVELGLDLLDRVAAHMEQGNYLETAADLEGVSVSTLRDLAKTGARELRRMELDGNGPAPELERAVHFSAALKKARAKAESDGLTVINKAAQSQWQAAAWRLERRRPDRWGRRERHEHVGPRGGAIPIASVSMTPEQLKRLTDADLKALEAIAAKLTADGDDAGDATATE